jgi:hypothetical protein
MKRGASREKRSNNKKKAGNKIHEIFFVNQHTGKGDEHAMSEV